MPAKSKAQQRFMGMEYAKAKAGKKPDVKMSVSQLKDFASTKLKGLPKRAKKPAVGRGECNNIMHKKVGRGENMPPIGGTPPMGTGAQTMVLTGPDGKQYQYDPMTGKTTPMGGGMSQMGAPGIGEQPMMRPATGPQMIRPPMPTAGPPPQMGGMRPPMQGPPPMQGRPMMQPGGPQMRPGMAPGAQPSPMPGRARPAVQPRPAGRRTATVSGAVGAGEKKSSPAKAKAKSGKK